MSWIYLTLYGLSLVSGWCLTALGLWGNWLIVAASIGYWLLIPNDFGYLLSPYIIGLQIALALLGELFEGLAGVLGAKKAGASKRALFFSLVGSIIGALFGFGIGSGILPVIGSLMGSILFAALGSMIGAWLGEWWKGRGAKEVFSAGRAAFWGRILGTLAKSLIGTAMTIIGVWALF